LKTALIVGSGQRVRAAALPAFLRAGDRFRIGGIFSRTGKRIEAAGTRFDVAPLEELDATVLAGADLLYMVVAKDAVPAVLGRIARHDVSHLDLLIETPVLRFRLLGHLGLLAGFRNTWVSEDCSTLPAFDALAAFRAARGLGAVERVTLDRSGYAYHGLAIGRTLLEAGRVRSARRSRGNGVHRRRVRFQGGGELVVIEPRDYAVGRLRVDCAGGAISDDPAAPGTHRLAAVLEGQACAGFRVGDTEVALTPDERALMGSPLAAGPEAAGAGVTVWMEGMKRVGFLRLLQRIDAGRGAYSLAQALEDTVVDYHLEKLGLYVPNPLTSPHLASGRLFLRALTRLSGG